MTARSIKTLLISAALLVAAPLLAVDQITVAVTVTNAPSDGNTITLNSSTRTWRTTPAAPNTEVTINADVATSATNLFNHFSNYPQASATLGWTATNAFNVTFIPGLAVTDSLVGTWGTLTRSTNSITSSYQILVPGAAHPTQSVATNLFSLLASDLATYSTNKFPAVSTGVLMDNYVDISSFQTIGGDKVFTGGVLFLGSTNLFGSSVAVPALGKFYFNGGSKLIFDTASLVQDIGATKFWNFEATADGETVFRWLDSTNFFNAHIRDNGHTYTGTNTFDLLTGSTIDASAITKFTNLTGSSGNITNVLNWGGALYSGTITNAAVTLDKYPRTDNTALVNGGNAAVNFGNTSFVRLDSGPSAAFTIHGIVGGSDGRTIRVYNNTGQNMTLAHQSGTDPTAANRLITMTGADVSTTSNGFAEIIYDSGQSRWIVAYVTP